MRKIHNTVADVVRHGLCTSCGICMGTCKQNAITFMYGRERNFPQINDLKCITCGACYKVCPGKGIQLNSISFDLFSKEDNIQRNLYAGFFLNSYIGYSTDNNIRYHAATGGMVSQFLIYLLKKNLIDGAVVVRYNKDNIFEPEPFIATSEAEIWESRSSKYVIVSMDKVVHDMLNMTNKRLVVVGLPCHIQAWRQIAKQNKCIKQLIVGYFAIYCSLNKTKHSIEYYPYRYNVDKSQVGHFVFRDDGCLGYMKFSDKQGNVIKKIPYLKFWFGTHSFFTNSRCSLCIDQLGELADVSFGDIHIEPYASDKIGTNSIITRSLYWDKILNNCTKDGYISLSEVNLYTLLKSQEYVKTFKKGAGVKANFLLRKIIHKHNPIYDYSYTGKVNLSNILSEISKAIMRSIGKHRTLWFLIRIIDRG